jgi:predicted enzyme related to lactoylglutathione lyase
MITGARYVHTNIVARDWRALGAFYQTVFGCSPVPPERDFSGPDVETLTGVPGAALRGCHLRLPGTGCEGPTLEIFEHAVAEPGPQPAVNRRGLAHIAFAVDSVPDARRAVLEAGGGAIGAMVSLTTTDGAEVTLCYVTDPEGNVIELQSLLHGEGRRSVACTLGPGRRDRHRRREAASHLRAHRPRARVAQRGAGSGARTDRRGSRGKWLPPDVRLGSSPA